MIKTPVRGMRDILPNDLILREYLFGVISEEARKAGFQKIETPMMEHLENLSSKDGGENEKLIFKVLKRGRELERGVEAVKGDGEFDELSDSALRYDLTVPLSRFYATHSAELPAPFKALQMGPVWRADAPQKGRYRQFTQCDMDILGDGSVLAEITAVGTAVNILSKICQEAGVSGLTLHVNDRRLLSAAAEFAGFSEEELGEVLISLDKNDKIGFDGVSKELVENDFDEEKVTKFISLFSEEKSVSEFFESLGEKAPEGVLEDLEAIIAAVSGQCTVEFDPTIVRGMGYYTGPIFEITADGLGSSIGGGGRYDKMIGKFSGMDVPAAGFSIGFERLCVILEDLGFKPAETAKKCAILVSNKVPTARYAEIAKQAEEKRKDGGIVSVIPMMRNLGRQIQLLEEAGFTEIEKIYEKN